MVGWPCGCVCGRVAGLVLGMCVAAPHGHHAGLASCAQIIARSCGTIVPLVRVFQTEVPGEPAMADVMLMYNPEMEKPAVPTVDMTAAEIVALWQAWTG